MEFKSTHPVKETGGSGRDLTMTSAVIILLVIAILSTFIWHAIHFR